MFWELDDIYMKRRKSPVVVITKNQEALSEVGDKITPSMLKK
jgi:hypothetical protein